MDSLVQVVLEFGRIYYFDVIEEAQHEAAGSLEAAHFGVEQPASVVLQGDLRLGGRRLFQQQAGGQAPHEQTDAVQAVAREVEQVGVEGLVLVLVGPEQIEQLHTGGAADLEGLVHARRHLEAAHLAVFREKQVRLHDAVALPAAVGRGVVVQHGHALLLHRLVKNGEVAGYVVVYAVAGQHLEVVERGEFFAQVAHLRRIVINGVEDLVDGDGFIVGEVDAVGDLPEKR